MVLVKNVKFWKRFVFCKIHPEKVFGDVLVRKQAFLDNINMDLKRKQNWHFAGGYTGLQGVTKGYRVLKSVTMGDKGVTRGYRGLQRIIETFL